jgi:hypothetical protein
VVANEPITAVGGSHAFTAPFPGEAVLYLKGR